MHLPSELHGGLDRRRFFKGSATVVTGLAFPGGIGRAQQDGPKVALLMLEPEIEKIVQLIEQTERKKCFEVIARLLHDGLTARDFAAALFLAGVRNVSPHPLGFKFHCVLAVHAAHQLGSDIGGPSGLLPLFWMLDDFKSAQEKDRLDGDYRMTPFTGKLPSPEAAERELKEALDKWDEDRAERAMAVLAQTQGAQRISSLLWPFGARDFRNIGHKATYVAGALRVLDTIGWQHAEPVLRSVAAAMTDFGRTAEVNGFTFESQCYLNNLKLLVGLDPTALLALQAKDRSAATQRMFALLRKADHADACAEAVKSLQATTSDTVALWDSAMLAAGDLIMRRRGIAGIHAVTSIQALHYAYVAASEPNTRLLLLLQAIGWVCQFRKFMEKQKEGLEATSILELQPASTPAPTADALDLIFSSVGKDHLKAAALSLHYAQQGGSINSFKHRARNLLAAKTVEVHGWKYPASCFELLNAISAPWRPYFLAATTYYLAGSTQKDSPVLLAAKDILKLR